MRVSTGRPLPLGYPCPEDNRRWRRTPRTGVSAKGLSHPPSVCSQVTVVSGGSRLYGGKTEGPHPGLSLGTRVTVVPGG